MKNMSFLTKLDNFTTKWPVLHPSAHFLKHFIIISYTIGISEVFLIV